MADLGTTIYSPNVAYAMLNGELHQDYIVSVTTPTSMSTATQGPFHKLRPIIARKTNECCTAMSNFEDSIQLDFATLRFNSDSIQQRPDSIHTQFK